jgi:hypothetical protein
MRLTKYLATSRTEDVIEMTNAFMSFILAFFFMLDTYYSTSPPAIQYMELVIIAYMTCDFLLFFYISENRLLYLFSF